MPESASANGAVAWAYYTRVFALHVGCCFLVFFFMFYAAPVLWLGCFFFRALRPSWPRAVLFQLGICALGCLLLAVVFFFDPTHFIQSVLDG